LTSIHDGTILDRASEKGNDRVEAMALLDVILGYDCNLACDYCTITAAMRRRALGSGAVVAALDRGRALGYDEVSFTGGEPTIRGDLLGLIKAARARGYRDIKLQSNGLLLASEKNVDALISAGVTRFHVSIHTHDPAAYCRTVQREGAYSLMEGAVRNLAAREVVFVADVILKEDTYRSLLDALAWLSERGVSRADLWFVSLTDGNRDNLASMPRMTDVVPLLQAGFRWARRERFTLRSLHVPRCLLGDCVELAWDPGADRVMVVSPDATFELRDSKLAGRRFVDACNGCAWRAICPGLRPDYLERYGDEEIARARGLPAAIRPTRQLPLAT
jgi:MoaA/NifB/PqqE/SkfB family radical SAM enzyme